MQTMQGPGLFLAQFLRDETPFNNLCDIARWAAGMGYLGVQIPSWDARMIDLERASTSQDYCDEYRGILQEAGLCITEIAAPIQGQVLALHPAYAAAFQHFYPTGLSDAARVEWAALQLRQVILASAGLGTRTIPALTGGFAWHMAYPWPQRPPGLIEEAFGELARRWRPLLDLAHEHGLTFAFEPHPGSDVFDGATYEMFLNAVGSHPAACLNYDPSHFVLQQLDYLEFIQIYGARIHGFHVKDAEFRPTGRVGIYGGYQPWAERAGRFRSLGDGQIDFRRVFTLLTEAGFAGWAVLEWECCVKSPQQGAEEGAAYIASHMIRGTEVAFDDFAGAAPDAARNRRILGLPA